jgi:alpha-D-ribose 1-methylphosphonate 5-triphosphate synthase subunit PhnH
MDRERTLREHETFRNLLQAFARPGSVRSAFHGVSDRDHALEFVACSLLDGESSLGVLGDTDLEIASRIQRLTGCVSCNPGSADFVLAGNGSTLGRLIDLRTGDPDYPDRGATVVYLVDEIRPEGGVWSWRGPGIPDTIRPLLDGLHPSELPALREINHSYPLGLDALFVDRAGRITALPRSTRLSEVAP